MGVYKEGKNWKVQVYYKDWQGNQKRKQKRGFRTKGEAKEWERDFLQQQSQGVDIEFGNFLEIYYKDMDIRLREHTMYTKRYITIRYYNLQDNPCRKAGAIGKSKGEPKDFWMQEEEFLKIP